MRVINNFLKSNFLRINSILTGLSRGWRFVTHCGVTPNLPRDDIKYVVVTNVFVVCGITLMLIYPYVNYRIGHPATNIVAVVELIAAPVFGLSLWMNYRGYYLAAPTWFVLCGLTVVTIAVVVAGKALGSDLFYIVLAIAPFLIYPRHRLRIAALMSLAGLLAALVTLFINNDDPIVGGPIVRAGSVHSFIWSYAGMYAMLIVIGYHARKITQILEDELISERHLSERLLRNMLPDSVALRLKQNVDTVADHYPEATVLFADIVDFTPLSAQLTPRDLVAFLNLVFSKFDHLVEELRLEKIKTIGDAYMVAGGILDADPDSAGRIMQLAILMQHEVSLITTPAGTPLRLRIGLSTGPVIAGVIGFKKFIYDLWGDTVNMASRMESQGLPDVIQVTGRTYELLKNKYSFTQRGLLEIKGKGQTMTWIYSPPPVGKADAVP